MKIIKLDAIDSTNDFLKELCQNEKAENFTIITAKSQTKGRGQMGTNWASEAGKNLTFSTLIKEHHITIHQIFDLNIATAIAVVNALKKNKIPDISIKWPNDIMAGNKKIGGILIENLFREGGNIESIIGIGLNINQTNFENLPKASSLKVITSQDFEVDTILQQIIEELQWNVEQLKHEKNEALWSTYHELLFNKSKPVVFEDTNQKKFMGIIQKVNRNGQLEVLLEDDSVQQYGIKEITMLF